MRAGTGTRQAQAEVPGLITIELPEDVNVAAEYGIVRLHGEADAGPRQAAAQRLIDALSGPGGQAVLARYGFAPG